MRDVNGHGVAHEVQRSIASFRFRSRRSKSRRIALSPRYVNNCLFPELRRTTKPPQEEVTNGQ